MSSSNQQTISSTTATAGTTATTPPKYLGSCHCKLITYSACIDLAADGFTKCNCSICQKAGYLMANPLPGTFELRTPKEGESGLSDYQFGAKTMHHLFCLRCGVRCFLKGTYEGEGGKMHEFLGINALTLDGREDGKEMEDLREVKTRYSDGRTGNFEMAEKPYDGGVW